MNNRYKNLLLNKDNVIIITASMPFNLHIKEVENNISLLDVEEMKRFNRYKVEKKKIEFLCGRILQKTVLASVLGVKPKDISFLKNSYGKLFLKHNSEIKFNLSHSGNKLLFAITKKKNIGVDIKKNEEDILDLMELVFLADEISYVNSHCSYHQRREAFYKIWTKKEAFMKLVDRGFNLSPLRFSVPIETKENHSDYIVYETIVPFKDYVMTIAIEKTALDEDLNLIYEDIDIMEILKSS